MEAARQRESEKYAPAIRTSFALGRKERSPSFLDEEAAAIVARAQSGCRTNCLELPVVLEKLTFGLAALVLYVHGRMGLLIAGAGTVDLVLAAVLVLAIRLTRIERQ
jgi:hypothetical protein